MTRTANLGRFTAAWLMAAAGCTAGSSDASSREALAVDSIPAHCVPIEEATMTLKNGETGQPTISLEKSTFHLGEPIVVHYANLPGGATDWVGTYVAGRSHQNYIQYIYTEGRRNGTMTFDGLKAGHYEVRLFFNDCYKVEEIVSFDVVCPEDYPDDEGGGGDSNTSGGGDSNTSGGGDSNTSGGGDSNTSGGGDSNTSGGGDSNTSGGGDSNTSGGGDSNTSGGGDGGSATSGGAGGAGEGGNGGATSGGSSDGSSTSGGSNDGSATSGGAGGAGEEGSGGDGRCTGENGSCPDGGDSETPGEGDQTCPPGTVPISETPDTPDSDPAETPDDGEGGLPIFL